MRKLKKIVKWCGICIGALLILIIITHTTLNIIWGRELRAKLAEFKASGKPMTIAEIIPPLVPDDENAALLLNKVFAAMTEGGEYKRIASAFDNSKWTEKQKEEIAALINSSEMQEIYTLLEVVAKKPKCNFNLKYEKGPWIDQLPVMKMRDAMRLFVVKGLLEVEAGDTDKALDTLFSGLKIVNHFKAEPFFISQMVRLACDRTMVNCIQDIANSEDIPVEKTALLIKQLSTCIDRAPVIKAMDTERICFGMWIFEKIMQHKLSASGLPGSDKTPFWGKALVCLAKPIIIKNFIFYLILTSEDEKILTLPYSEAVSIAKKMEEKMVLAPEWHSLIAGALISNLHNIREGIARHDAIVQICRVGLALKIYKAINGHYPELLDKLAPQILKEIPLDPFTGKSLIYRESDTGFILYSLGPNLKDDNGAPRTGKQNENAYREYDIIWKCESL